MFFQGGSTRHEEKQNKTNKKYKQTNKNRHQTRNKPQLKCAKETTPRFSTIYYHEILTTSLLSAQSDPVTGGLLQLFQSSGSPLPSPPSLLQTSMNPTGLPTVISFQNETGQFVKKQFGFSCFLSQPVSQIRLMGSCTCRTDADHPLMGDALK